MTLETKGAIASAGLLVGGITLQSIVPAVLGIGLGILVTWFWRVQTAKTKAKDDAVEKQDSITAKQADRIAALETQLALVGQQVLPLSAAWQKYLIEQLTHFHTPELDALMPKKNRTEEEDARMLVLLKERITVVNGRIDPAERVAAEMLPLVIQFIRVEKKTDHMKVPEVIAVEKPAPEESAASEKEPAP